MLHEQQCKGSYEAMIVSRRRVLGSFCEFTVSDIHEKRKTGHLVYSSGKPIISRRVGTLARVRRPPQADSLTQSLSNGTPWIYGILDFCNVRVNKAATTSIVTYLRR